MVTLGTVHGSSLTRATEAAMALMMMQRMRVAAAAGRVCACA
jgi:hypothetical protein